MTDKLKPLKVCWISAGVSSFIAGYLERDSIDKFIYIDVADQHPDSLRFIKDCEKLLGKPIEIAKSKYYTSVEDACRAKNRIKIPRTGYAPCTNWLKKAVRKEREYKHMFDYDITYVWGMDVEEKARAERLVEGMFEFNHQFPLIDRNISKQDAHGMCEMLGIKRPVMYDMGYKNNNCIGCVKGGMGYWNKIRVDFPEVFQSRAELERDLGMSILKECFLDELDPNRGRMTKEIPMDCNIFCQLNL